VISSSRKSSDIFLDSLQTKLDNLHTHETEAIDCCDKLNLGKILQIFPPFTVNPLNFFEKYQFK